MKKVYFISGLGADKSIFAKLNLPGIEPVFLEWFTPKKNETTEHYAERMHELIDMANPVIVGVSFGGMMAIEIAKQIPVKKIILISSIKNSDEKPATLRFISAFNLHSFIPLSAIKNFHPVSQWFFGCQDREEEKLLSTLIKNSNNDIIEWSANAVLKWENNISIPNIVHIHGNADKVFPIENIKADYVVEGGSHLMVYSKAQEVSQILMKVL